MSLMVRRRMMGVKERGSRLPQGYEEKTCIYSTDFSTYINTEVVPTNDMVVTVDFQLTNDLSATNTCILGAYDGVRYLPFFLCTNKNVSGFICQKANQYTEFSTKDNNRHCAIIDVPSNRIHFDGSEFRLKGNTNLPSIPFFVFAANSHDGNIFRKETTGKLFYLKIEIGGNTVAEFIPCLRKADGKAGLYDVIRNQFYSSVGTNEFSAE